MFLVEVFKQPFWMQEFGHECLKRTLLWSVSPSIAKFAQWRLQKALLPPKKKSIRKLLGWSWTEALQGRCSHETKPATCIKGVVVSTMLP